MKRYPALYAALSIFILSAACYYDPVNTNHELLIINSAPDKGEVRATIFGETHLIKDLYYKAFFKDTNVSLSALSVQDNPRFSFWWFDNQHYTVTTENPWNFDISTNNWEIEAVFKWEENTDPIVMWDNSILYNNSHEGQRRLMHWKGQEQQSLIIHDPGRISRAGIQAYHPAEHAFYSYGSQKLLLDRNFTINHSFALSRSDVYPIANGTSLIHLKPHWDDDNSTHDLHFISKQGIPARIVSLNNRIRLKIYSPGSAQRLFAVESHRNMDGHYQFQTLHTINMHEEADSPESRLQQVQNIPTSANPASASLESGYFLFTKWYYDYFLPDRFQFIITDGENIMMSPPIQNPLFSDVHKITQSSIHWVSDNEFMARKPDESWIRFSIEDGKIHNAPDPDYVLPEWPQTYYASSKAESRGATHSEGYWTVEANWNNGPTDLFLLHENGDSIQITGSEDD